MNHSSSGIQRIRTLWDAVRAANDQHPSGDTIWRCLLPPVSPRELDAAVQLGWLTELERTAAGRRATPDLMSRFGARRILRRLMAASSLGTSPEEVHVEARCSLCGETGHGRPQLEGPTADPHWMSTSCCGDQLVVAVGAAPLGVDIEAVSQIADISSSAATRAIPGWSRVSARWPNASFSRTWTALEALSKVTGRGLTASVEEIDAVIASHQLVWFTDGVSTVRCLATMVGTPAPVTINMLFR